LLSILSAHPDIYTIKNQTYAFEKWNKNGLPKRLDRLYREFIFHKIPKEPNRWCEKTPKNVEYFGNILNYFQSAKIVHLIRDGRDVVTSSHPKHNPNGYWVSPQRWVKDVKIGLRFENHPNVLTLFYEKLINNYRKEVKKLCKFIGVNFDTNLLHWRNNTAIKNSKHWKKPVQKLHSRSIGRWEKPKHKKRMKEFCSNTEAVKLLEELNYT